MLTKSLQWSDLNYGPVDVPDDHVLLHCDVDQLSLVPASCGDSNDNDVALVVVVSVPKSENEIVDPSEVILTYVSLLEYASLLWNR